ncbi:MAG TPA: putative quinol monooxygenase [Streptosporangiaceae bacterium]|jgi:quinol monooxygenase YgiN
MPVTVVATITPKPEHRDEVIAAMKKAIPLVHAEDGCELYALHTDDEHLVMVERWTSREALKKHGTEAPAMREFGAAVGDKLAAPTVVLRLDAVPAGDPAKGQLS